MNSEFSIAINDLLETPTYEIIDLETAKILLKGLFEEKK